VFAGKGLTEAQIADIYDCFDAYMTAIGN